MTLTTRPDVAPEHAPAPRWAIITDAELDDRTIASMRAMHGEGLVAVMVLPRYYEATRHWLDGAVRCTTHPTELQMLGVDQCLIWDATEILEQHGSALRERTLLVPWSGPSDESGSAQASSPDPGLRGAERTGRSNVCLPPTFCPPPEPEVPTR